MSLSAKPRLRNSLYLKTKSNLKPFISYVGSKSKIMSTIDSKLPKIINSYFEPFVGGGSVLYHIGTKYPHIENFYINDMEVMIMNLYSVIKYNCEEFIEVLKYLNKRRDRSTFFKMLDIFNNEKLPKIYKSALYLYFFKLAFNNNLKYTKDGKIKPTFSSTNAKCNLYKEENIRIVSKFLKKTHLYNEDYVKFLKRFDFKKNDFVFLDPPYNVSCVKEYYSNTFSENDYVILLKTCDMLTKKGVNWMMTLDSSKSHLKLFHKYKIHKYRRHSFISNGLNKDQEVIITNY
jgi:DNA adenine methylase